MRDGTEQCWLLFHSLPGDRPLPWEDSDYDARLCFATHRLSVEQADSLCRTYHQDADEADLLVWIERHLARGSAPPPPTESPLSERVADLESKLRESGATVAELRHQLERALALREAAEKSRDEALDDLLRARD